MKRIAAAGVVVLVFAAMGMQARGQGAQAVSVRWQAERAGMLKQVLDRARGLVRDLQLMVEIGTMAPIDVRSSTQMLADLEAMVDADGKRGPVQTRPDQIASTRIRFAEALNNLDALEVRFNAGMISTKNMNDALMAAANIVLTR